MAERLAGRRVPSACSLPGTVASIHVCASMHLILETVAEVISVFLRRELRHTPSAGGGPTGGGAGIHPPWLSLLDPEPPRPPDANHVCIWPGNKEKATSSLHGGGEGETILGVGMVQRRRSSLGSN